MIKLMNILTEALSIYRIEILIKTSADKNQVFIYNEFRGIKDIVVVTVVQNDFLRSKSTDKYQYALLKVKYLATQEPEVSINNIKIDALTTNKIPGLIQFIPRYSTIEKVGQY